MNEDFEFKRAEDFLYALRNAGSKYSLDRIRRLSSHLGNPHLKYPIIHVAGTNGKGSVCAMLERIMRAAGMKCGMFTSPHLLYLGERIQIDRSPISKEILISRIAELRTEVDKLFDMADVENYPSFFEYMTMLAFNEFARGNVDCAVVEVGLGGRLDSTNIVSPAISVISSIGFDHTQFLGNSIAEIAREKAGIIKADAPVVCGFLPDEAMKIIRDTAEKNNAPLYCAADYFADDASLPQTSLFGYYQRRNAALATLCVRVLRDSKSGAKIFEILTDDIVKEALMNVDWPARWQSVSLKEGGILILDSSHNEEGARTLERNLQAMDFGGKKPVIAVGILGEERAAPLLKVVAKYAAEIVTLVPDQPRALSHEALAALIPPCAAKVSASGVSELFKEGNSCPRIGRGDFIVCTGSIYLAGEVMAALGGKAVDALQDRI